MLKKIFSNAFAKIGTLGVPTAIKPRNPYPLTLLKNWDKIKENSKEKKMTTISDLTFEQINTEAIADPNIGAAIFTLSGTDISLDVSLLTGDTYTALTDEGVLEAFFKFRQLAFRAQETVNATLNLTATPPDVPLDTFTPSSETGVINGEEIEISFTETVRVKLDYSNIFGSN